MVIADLIQQYKAAERAKLEAARGFKEAADRLALAIRDAAQETDYLDDGETIELYAAGHLVRASIASQCTLEVEVTPIRNLDADRLESQYAELRRIERAMQIESGRLEAMREKFEGGSNGI